MNTLVNFRPAQPSKTGQFSTGVNTGGLIVDYLGLADQLKEALATYTSSGGRGSTNESTDAAVEILVEKCEVARAMLHGYDWSSWMTAGGAQRLALIPGAQEHVLEQENGKKRFVTVSTEISS